MKALQYRAVGAAPERVTVPDPEPGPVLLKVTVAGVCHADIAVMSGPPTGSLKALQAAHHRTARDPAVARPTLLVCRTNVSLRRRCVPGGGREGARRRKRTAASGSLVATAEWPAGPRESAF
ncbi:hypothetical protein QFZ71_000175 [Streptomyces sp. V2I9]|nr:hypothetical protein [Streptomyces sp. V2I9]